MFNLMVICSLSLSTYYGVVCYDGDRFDFLAGARWLATKSATEAISFLSTSNNGTIAAGSSISWYFHHFIYNATLRSKAKLSNKRSPTAFATAYNSDRMR